MIPGEHVDARSLGGERDGTDTSTHRATIARLERAFTRHRERGEHADCARVVVHETDDGRYEYVDGVHYVTGVADAARDRIEAFASARGLETVMDGHAGFAFQTAEPNTAADVHVAGAVVEAGFDAQYTDLDDVVEVVDGETVVAWTELDPQPA